MPQNDKEMAQVYLNNDDLNNFKEMIKSEGFKIDTQYEKGRTLLHQACFLKKLNFIKLLIENNSDINAQNINGTTAIMYAKSNIIPSEYPILDLLVEHGAKIYQKDKFERTVFDYIDNTEVKNYLFKLGQMERFALIGAGAVVTKIDLDLLGG